MEKSHPSSGRSATPADINRNARPTSSESALQVGTGGDLHPYVPKRLGWYRTIGDGLCATIRGGEPVDEIDIERLLSVLDMAVANERVACVKRKPKLGQALRFDRMSFIGDFLRWEVEVASLRDAIRVKTVGSA